MNSFLLSRGFNRQSIPAVAGCFGLIYKLVNLFNGKLYIGKTARSLFSRLDEHVTKKKSPTYLDRAIQKYGRDNFSCEVIDFANSEEQLNKKEKHWISFYRTNNRKIGYNLAEGGQAGIVSNEQRIYRAKNFIRCNETQETFIATTDAARHKNIDIDSIRSVVSGKSLSYRGLTWSKVPKTQENINRLTFVDRKLSYHGDGKGCSKKVRQIETGIVYKSVSEAARNNNTDPRYICYSIKNNKKCKGYTYEYLDLVISYPVKLENECRRGKITQDRFGKKIKCLETNEIWASLKSAGRAIGGSGAALYTALKKRNGKYKGSTYIYLT